MADGVSMGYAEARVAAGAWKARRGVRRPWRRIVHRNGLTGARLEAWVRAQAAQYPGQVRVH